MNLGRLAACKRCEIINCYLETSKNQLKPGNLLFFTLCDIAGARMSASKRTGEGKNKTILYITKDTTR